MYYLVGSPLKGIYGTRGEVKLLIQHEAKLSAVSDNETSFESVTPLFSKATVSSVSSC